MQSGNLILINVSASSLNVNGNVTGSPDPISIVWDVNPVGPNISNTKSASTPHGLTNPKSMIWLGLKHPKFLTHPQFMVSGV
jgi:hypothetical protein